MRLTPKIKLGLVGLSIIAALFSALLVVGRFARMEHFLTIYIAGFIGGAAASSFFWGRTKTEMTPFRPPDDEQN